MPSSVREFVNQDRFNTPNDSVRAETIPSERPGWTTLPVNGPSNAIGNRPPMSGFAAWSRKPTMNLILPDPTVGGYAEQQNASGWLADPGFSSHARQSFAAQGHYDSIPERYADPLVTGAGTPNVHGKYLRQGVLTQLAGYTAPSAVNNIGYVAALTRGSGAFGASENGLRL